MTGSMTGKWLTCDWQISYVQDKSTTGSYGDNQLSWPAFSAGWRPGFSNSIEKKALENLFLPGV
jgi:hypothetical protein